MYRVIMVVIAAVIVIVENHSRIPVITQGAPTIMVIPLIPMHPGRPHMSGGNPIPSQSQAPLPPSIMGDTPAPGVIRNPSPTYDRIPFPATVAVGTPGIMIYGRNPDIPILSFIDPPAIISQLIFIFRKLAPTKSSRYKYQIVIIGRHRIV